MGSPSSAWRRAVYRAPHGLSSVRRIISKYPKMPECVALARLVRAANLLARDRPAQRSADITDIKRSGAQWEDAPHQRQDAEQMVPEDETEDKESHARDDAKAAPRGTIDEVRET